MMNTAIFQWLYEAKYLAVDLKIVQFYGEAQEFFEITILKFCFVNTKYSWRHPFKYLWRIINIKFWKDLWRMINPTIFQQLYLSVYHTIDEPWELFVQWVHNFSGIRNLYFKPYLEAEKIQKNNYKKIQVF